MGSVVEPERTRPVLLCGDHGRTDAGSRSDRAPANYHHASGALPHRVARPARSRSGAFGSHTHRQADTCVRPSDRGVAVALRQLLTRFAATRCVREDSQEDSISPCIWRAVSESCSGAATHRPGVWKPQQHNRARRAGVPRYPYAFASGSRGRMSRPPKLKVRGAVCCSAFQLPDRGFKGSLRGRTADDFALGHIFKGGEQHDPVRRICGQSGADVLSV